MLLHWRRLVRNYPDRTHPIDLEHKALIVGGDEIEQRAELGPGPVAALLDGLGHVAGERKDLVGISAERREDPPADRIGERRLDVQQSWCSLRAIRSVPIRRLRARG